MIRPEAHASANLRTLDTGPQRRALIMATDGNRVDFYYNRGQRIDLIPVPKVYAVKFRPEQ